MEPQISSKHFKDSFTMIKKDHCVYIRLPNSDLIVLSTYVIDIFILRNCKKLLDAITKKWLSLKFEIKIRNRLAMC